MNKKLFFKKTNFVLYCISIYCRCLRVSSQFSLFFFCLSCLHSNNCLITFLYFSKQGAEKEDETAEDAQEEDVGDIEHEEEENEAEEEANDDMQENDEETALIDELGNYFKNWN